MATGAAPGEVWHSYRSHTIIERPDGLYQVRGLPTTWQSLGAAQAGVDILRRQVAERRAVERARALLGEGG